MSETTVLNPAFSPDRFARLGSGDDALDTFARHLDERSGQVGLMRCLRAISAVTGNYVQLIQQLGYMPSLIGSDHQPIFLYNLVEGIDEFLDVDALLQEYPTLNFAQIEGAMSFIRKMAQVNARSIDIDDLEDEYDGINAQLLAALEVAYNDQEIVRVLSQPE